MPRAYEVLPGTLSAVRPRRKGRTGHGRMPLSGRPGDHQSSGAACRERPETMSVSPYGRDTYGFINKWMAPFSPHFPI
jgi:hypothetical protein